MSAKFLRVVPRVPAVDVVAEVLLTRGIDPSQALHQARTLLLRLNIPARLHAIPPATFSGGEQQRVNLARGSSPAIRSCCWTNRPPRSMPRTGPSWSPWCERQKPAGQRSLRYAMMSMSARQSPIGCSR